MTDAAFAGLAVDALALATCLDTLWARIERDQPHRPIARAAFLGYLAERVDCSIARTGDVLARLAAVHVEDLYLACACVAGDSAAITTFETRIVPRVESTLAGMKISGAERSDVMQMLRERMIARTAIAKYDGRGPLASWLKVCAVRIARERAEHDRRFIAIEASDEAIGNLAPGVPDPELVHLQQRYGTAFKAAFARAVAALPARQRTLLRLSVLDGLGIDQIAAIYHVHRATAARRIHAAREELVASTRAAMAADLQLGPTELESVMRLIRSIADVTLRLLLPTPATKI